MQERERERERRRRREREREITKEKQTPGQDHLASSFTTKKNINFNKGN